MPTIIEFLEARIAEDESDAMASMQDLHEVGPDWGSYFKEVVARNGIPGSIVADATTSDHARHIARHDPSRVLAECAAKRRMLSYVPKMSDEFNPIGGTSEFVLRCLCFPYMGHPDYNHDEWAL